MRIAIVVSIVLTVFVVYGFVVASSFSSWGERGQFGDMFGAANAFFAALAFCGVAYSLWLQAEQRKDDQRRHERESELAFLSTYLQCVPTILAELDQAMGLTKGEICFENTRENQKEKLLGYLKKRNEITERMNRLLVVLNEQVDRIAADNPDNRQ